MATNSRKKFFHIDEKASSEQIFRLLDDVDNADEDDIDNLMNNSDIESIAEEEITQAGSTQDTSLATPNLQVVPSDNQSRKKEKNKKEEL